MVVVGPTPPPPPPPPQRPALPAAQPQETTTIRRLQGGNGVASCGAAAADAHGKYSGTHPGTLNSDPSILNHSGILHFTLTPFIFTLALILAPLILTLPDTHIGTHPGTNLTLSPGAVLTLTLALALWHSCYHFHFLSHPTIHSYAWHSYLSILFSIYLSIDLAFFLSFYLSSFICLFLYSYIYC